MDLMVQTAFVSTVTGPTSPDALIFNPHRILTTPGALYSYPPSSKPVFQIDATTAPDPQVLELIVERAREAVRQAAAANGIEL